jgi:hypothetical protein
VLQPPSLRPQGARLLRWLIALMVRLRIDMNSGSRSDHQAPPVRHLRCRATCAFGGVTERHHTRLMAIEYDQDAFLELMELAVTWPELEYSETRTIPPDSWMAFVESHRWADPDRIDRIFSVATDIAMAARRAAVRRDGINRNSVGGHSLRSG